MIGTRQHLKKSLRITSLHVWQHVKGVVRLAKHEIHTLFCPKSQWELVGFPYCSPVVRVFFGFGQAAESALARSVFGNAVGPVEEFTD